MPIEVIEFALHTQNHYKQAMDSGDETTTIPSFELFLTQIVSSKNPNWVLQCPVHPVFDLCFADLLFALFWFRSCHLPQIYHQMQHPSLK